MNQVLASNPTVAETSAAGSGTLVPEIVIVPLFSVSMGIVMRFGSVRLVDGNGVRETVTGPTGAEEATSKSTRPRASVELAEGIWNAVMAIKGIPQPRPTIFCRLS